MNAITTINNTNARNLKILLRDGSEHSFPIYPDESVHQVLSELCISRRWTRDMIQDYWFERQGE